MLPEGWREVAFGEVASFRNGLNFLSTSRGGEVRVVGIPHFWERRTMESFHEIEPTPVGRLSDDDYLRSGDLLFVRSNGNKALIGRCMFFPAVGQPVAFSGFTIRARTDASHLLPAFAAALTQTRVVKDQIARGGGGTNISNLSQAILSSLRIPLPPLPEQKKIAEILSTWDAAIDTTAKLLANAEEQKRALMHQLLTGKRRLKGFEDCEWVSISLTQLALVQMGSSPPSSAYNEFGEGLPLIQGNADLSAGMSAPRMFTRITTQECLPGDSLLSVRAPVGAVARSIHRACIGRGIAAVRARSERDQEWLHQWLLWFEPQWKPISQGSTFEAVNSKEIRGLVVFTSVASDERAAVGGVLAHEDEAIRLLHQQLVGLAGEKGALMQQLLTGKRRVRT